MNDQKEQTSMKTDTRRASRGSRPVTVRLRPAVYQYIAAQTKGEGYQTVVVANYVGEIVESWMMEHRTGKPLVLSDKRFWDRNPDNEAITE